MEDEEYRPTKPMYRRVLDARTKEPDMFWPLLLLSVIGIGCMTYAAYLTWTLENDLIARLP